MIKILFAIFLLCFFSCQNQHIDDQIQPRSADITETVYASVKIIPAFSYFSQPVRSGIIKKIFIREGDEVQKGQKILQISIPANTENQWSTAKLNLQEAEANFRGPNNLLRNLRSEIQSVNQQLLLDSITLQRLESLWAKNIGRKNDYDIAKLTYTKTKNQLAILQQREVQTRINLENNYKKAQNLVKTESSQLADYTIYSEINGIVFSLNKEVGDFINNQERFAEIGSSDNYIIQMDIDEVDITKIAIKDSVIIMLEAYPGKTFIARVTKIYPKKEASTQTFRVESVFDFPPPKLFNGLSGEANILVDRRVNATVIPSDYLLPDNKVLTPDGEVSVKTGLKNLEFVEIIEGIDTNTTLIKSDK